MGQPPKPRTPKSINQTSKRNSALKTKTLQQRQNTDLYDTKRNHRKLWPSKKKNTQKSIYHHIYEHERKTQKWSRQSELGFKGRTFTLSKKNRGFGTKANESGEGLREKEPSLFAIWPKTARFADRHQKAKKISAALGQVSRPGPLRSLPRPPSQFGPNRFYSDKKKKSLCSFCQIISIFVFI